MDIEVEHKFLVPSFDAIWSNTEPPGAVHGTSIVQGYLYPKAGRTLRIRLTDSQAMLAIKGAREHSLRIEFEESIASLEFAQQLLALCEPHTVCKIRYPLVHGKHLWAIDVFQDLNQGLVIAEIETGSMDEMFEIPEWCGADVTQLDQYYNENLARRPYSQWNRDNG